VVRRRISRSVTGSSSSGAGHVHSQNGSPRRAGRCAGPANGSPGVDQAVGWRLLLDPAQPPMKAIFLDEAEIFPRPGRSSVRRSSSILNFLPRIGFAPMHV